MFHFSKTARIFFMILSLGKVDNICFHTNLVSQLAALACQPGVHRNKDRIKQVIWQKSGEKLIWHNYIRCYISKTNARNIFIIIFLPKVENISFHLKLVSQLAALFCTIGVHGNFGNSKQYLHMNLVNQLAALVRQPRFRYFAWKMFVLSITFIQERSQI